MSLAVIEFEGRSHSGAALAMRGTRASVAMPRMDSAGAATISAVHSPGVEVSAEAVSGGGGGTATGEEPVQAVIYADLGSGDQKRFGTIGRPLKWITRCATLRTRTADARVRI